MSQNAKEIGKDVVGGATIAAASPYLVSLAIPWVSSATATIVTGTGGGSIMAPIVAPLMTFTAAPTAAPLVGIDVIGAVGVHYARKGLGM